MKEKNRLCDPCGRVLEETEQYYKSMNGHIDEKCIHHIICANCINESFDLMDKEYS